MRGINDIRNSISVVLKTLLILTLITAFSFQVWDQFIKYVTKKTSFSTRYKPVSFTRNIFLFNIFFCNCSAEEGFYRDFPVISLCFGYKILENNSKNKQLLDSQLPITAPSNLSFAELNKLYRSSTYDYTEVFESLSIYDSQKMKDFNTNVFHEGKILVSLEILVLNLQRFFS